MRLGVKFSRQGFTKYVSHLDMQRIFSRAVRRSGIPAAFSQGFNPHILMSFASAMPVGLETAGDYMEIGLTGEASPAECMARLAKTMPQGIVIVKTGLLPDGEKKLMAALKWAEYRIFAQGQEDDILEALDKIMAMDACMAVKTRKGKSREINIRPLIKSVEAKEGLRLVLALSGEQSLSPKLLLETMGQMRGKVFGPRILREELYTEKAGEILPLEKIGRAHV